MTGTVDVENKATEQVTKLRWCQLSQKTKRLKASSISSLVDQIFDGDLTVSDFATYLGKGGRENMVFWEDIKGELCLCLVAEKQERHLHAFLHLYRVLERISVALPLVYASTEPDYKKAMALLHSLTENPRDGELAVFQNFAQHLAKSGGYNELKINYTFHVLNGVWEKRASTQFEKFVLASGKVGDTREDLTGFDVKFEKVPSLLVNVRNRMFHRVFSGDNFDLDDLNGVDGICATMTKPTLYWLSLVVVEILKAHVKRFV